MVVDKRATIDLSSAAPIVSSDVTISVRVDTKAQKRYQVLVVHLLQVRLV